MKPQKKVVIDWQGDFKEPMGISAWTAYGRKYGYLDYAKDMMRISIMNELKDAIDCIIEDASITADLQDSQIIKNNIRNNIIKPLSDLTKQENEN